MSKVVIINGFPRAGKDSFVAAAFRAAPEHIKVFGMSTVDRVKEIAKDMGWGGEKDDGGRRFLHELKMAWSKYCDGPFNSVLQRVAELEHEFAPSTGKEFCLFVHSREPLEVDKFKQTIGPDMCSTLLIVRPGIETFDNPADKGVANYAYDYVVENPTNADFYRTLTAKAGDFLETLFQHKCAA